jgi:hypothetical protein
MGVSRGTAATDRRLREVDPEIVSVHVDATDVYISPDPTLQDEVRLRQQIGFLPLDLAGGRVNEEHPLWSWVLRHGAAEKDLRWLLEWGTTPDMIGLNMYPMFSQKRLVRSPRGLRIQMPYGDGEMVERLIDLYWNHFGRPMMISETAARGPVHRRRRWLDQSIAAIRRVRARGVPLVGYTWWPMFALVAWAYRQSNREIAQYLEQMGLWDLAADGSLDRRETPLVRAYQELTAGGTAAVGPLPLRPPTRGEDAADVQELLSGRV